MTCCLLSWHLVSVCFLGRKKPDKLTSTTAHRHQHRHQDFYCVSSVCVSEDVWVLESRKRELKLSSTRHTWDSFLSPGSGSRRSDGPVSHHSSLRWPLRYRLKETVPLLISDAERTSSQLATGGTHRRAEFDLLSDTGVQLKEPQSPSGEAAIAAHCAVVVGWLLIGLPLYTETRTWG